MMNKLDQQLEAKKTPPPAQQAYNVFATFRGGENLLASSAQTSDLAPVGTVQNSYISANVASASQSFERRDRKNARQSSFEGLAGNQYVNTNQDHSRESTGKELGSIGQKSLKSILKKKSVSGVSQESSHSRSPQPASRSPNKASGVIQDTSGSRDKVLKQLDDFNRSQVLSAGSQDYNSYPNVLTPLEQKQQFLLAPPGIDIVD